MSIRARAAVAAVGVLLWGAMAEAGALSPARAERALRHAQALADQGKAELAVKRLRPLLETNPDYAEAHVLAIRLRSQSERAVVHREYEQKLKADPESALLYFLVGYAAAEPAVQLRNYRKALELDPDLSLAQLELGRLCRSKAVDDLTASRRALETVAGLRPEWAEAHLELARTLAALGQLPQAIGAYRRAAELDRTCEAAWFERACLLSSRPAEAEQTLAEAVRSCPTSGRLWWHLADFKWTRGARDEAAACLERALALGPDAAYAREARNRLAAYCLGRGWHRSARRLGATAWSAAVEEMAEGRLPAEAFRLLDEARGSHLHFAHGGYVPSEDVTPVTPARRTERLQEAARMAPKSAIVQLELADALFSAGSHALAAGVYAKVLAGRPGDGELRRRCAEAELLAGRAAATLAVLGADRRRLSQEAAWMVADAEAMAAGQLAPEAIAARYAAGGAHLHFAHGGHVPNEDVTPEERQQRLRACVAKFPSYLTPRLELARVLREAGEAGEARAVLDAAAAVNGHPAAEADRHAQLGDLALAAKEHAKAIGHYKAAIERSPELARLHGALARACVGNGEFALACEALTRQLVLDPQSHDLPDSPRPGSGKGHWLVPRLGQGDLLRYRYSTDGGQPRRRVACVDFDYGVEAVGPGSVAIGAIEIVAVSGRPVEGGRDFVGARIHARCSSCVGLVAVDAPARGVPSEFANLSWLIQFLHGPALPAPRWPGQRWRSTAWTELGRPYAGDVTFERVKAGKAHLRVDLCHELPSADPATDVERVAAKGRAAIVFDLAQQVVERVELTMQYTQVDRSGSRAELPSWLHRLELRKVERRARKTP